MVGASTLTWVVLLTISITTCITNAVDINFTEWSTVGNIATGPMSHTTVLFYNETLITVGGCLTVDCVNQSSTIAYYSPSHNPSSSRGSGSGTLLVPPLSYPIAGHHTAVAFSSLVYVVRSCSMLIPGAPLPEPPTTTVPPLTSTTVAPPASTSSFLDHFSTHHTDDGAATQTPPPQSFVSPDVINEFGVVSEYDPSTGIVNDSFFIIPSEYVRANASCVNIANTIFIIGGFNLTSGEGLLTVDAIDIMNLEYLPNYARLDEALSNPSVSTDYTSIFVAGGRRLLTSRGVAGSTASKEGELSRYVWRFIPFMNPDTSSSCVQPLPTLPAAFTTPTNFSSDECELSILSFAGYLAVLNSETSQAAVLSIHFQDSQSTWAVIAWPSAPYNSTSANVSAFPVGATIGTVATKVDGNGTSSNSTVVLGSRLILYRFGGLVLEREWLTSNTSILVPRVTSNISMSESLGLLTLPAPTMKDRVISSGLFQFGMSGGNASQLCNGSAKSSPCRVRLSSRLDCVGNAAGTFDAPWYGRNVLFTATGASFPVYVCFSFGVSSYDVCNREEVSPTFFNTDALDPLDIQSGPVTSAPPATTAPPGAPAPSGTSLSTLLYIFGAVAAIATIVAVLLVSKLRKVPDEGLIAANANAHPTVGYGTHQEERYKILGKIGEGAFSVVYLVVRRADNVRFAMKHMECQSDLQRQEAIKECEIMRSLQGHPNVINLFDMFMNYEFDAAEPPNDEEAALLAASDRSVRKSRHLCLVMEYHAAGDLRKWALTHRGHISEAVLCSIAFQVTSVLRHIHAQDPAVIHRDLKPENILIVSLDDDAQVRGLAPPTMDSMHSSKISFLPVVITDFGLARIQEGNFCASGAGTLPYVAPECFRKKYTTQCDLWSLGCVLYAVATKRCNHDTVRLMFQDCEKKGFRSSIEADLAACALSQTFIDFVMMLIEPDMQLRLNAEQAFTAFRKKDDVVFLSSRVVQEKSSQMEVARAAALSRQKTRGPSKRTSSMSPQPSPMTTSAMNPEEVAAVDDNQVILPDSEASINSERETQ